MRPRRDDAAGPIQVDTEAYSVEIAREGYVSGVKGGSFLDKKTGARDLGFGLAVVDFLLEPARADEAVPKDQYEFGNAVHGDVPKRYVEGPQICTQAKRLEPELIRGDGFRVVRQRYRWTKAYAPRERAGSIWEQTLIFPDDERFFLASDRVTTVSKSPSMVMRLDMPGHIRHDQGKGFDRVYLSYNDPPMVPSSEFQTNFPPDARFRYKRGESRRPDRFIRGYQVDLGEGKPGPWLAGMTLNVEDVDEAWCHQRGYVCLIEEIGGRPASPGDTFGACYVVGWFDDVESMQAAYDRFRGWSGLAIEGPSRRPAGYRGVPQNELTPVLM